MAATRKSEPPCGAKRVRKESRALASNPDALSTVDAAPLLCAGVTTFNALRNARLRAGDLVAVQGVGGLGHLAIQFALANGVPYRRNRAGARKGKASN